MPKTLHSVVFIYLPKTKRFGMCDRNDNLTSDDFVSLSVSDYGGRLHIEEPDFTTTNPQDILNVILLHQYNAKGLSDEAFMWLEEEIMGDDLSWDEAVDRYLTTADNVKDSDYKVLNKQKEDYVLSRSSHKFGL